MAGTYAKYTPTGINGGGGGGGAGITSINGNTNTAQFIVGGTGINVTSVAGTTTVSNTGALDAFTIVQPDTGTSPTATSPMSTLTLHNPDARVPFNGNSSTNTITLDTSGLQSTGNYITALTGDVTATGPGSVPATLATVNGSPGTFTYATVTVNGKGLVTSASSGAAPTGTVTSVALADGSTTPIFTITGSPVTTSGTLTETLVTQAANKVFAGPTSGAAAQPTFRSLDVADMTIPTQAIAASNIDWSTGNLFTKTLAANTTFTFSNQLSGQTIVVRLTNTASNFTVTWPTVKWPNQVTPTMTVGAFSDVYTFVYDGTNTYGSYVQNF